MTLLARLTVIIDGEIVMEAHTVRETDERTRVEALAPTDKKRT